MGGVSRAAGRDPAGSGGRAGLTVLTRPLFRLDKESEVIFVSDGGTRSAMRHLVPELPVADVERAQRHYREVFGMKIAWLEPDKGMGAVRGEATIFFRRRTPPFEPAVHWVFAEAIEATYEKMKASGAKIVDPLETKPWGLRQFTVEDLDGNLFHFHNG